MPIVLGAQKSEAGRSLELKTFRSAWEVYWNSTSNNKHSKALCEALAVRTELLPSFPWALWACLLADCSWPLSFLHWWKKNEVLLKSQFVNILSLHSESRTLLFQMYKSSVRVKEINGFPRLKFRVDCVESSVKPGFRGTCSDSSVKSNAYSLYFSHLRMKNRQTQLYAGKPF